MLAIIYSALMINYSQAALIYSASQSSLFVDDKCRLINYTEIVLQRKNCQKGKIQLKGEELNEILKRMKDQNENEVIKIERIK